MTRTSITVDGARDLQKALRNFEGGIADLKVAHKEAAEIVATDAKPRARRKSGAMAGSIRATGQAAQGVVRAGFARLGVYPVIQHFGNPKRGISPNPFLYEAGDARVNDVLESYDSYVSGQITKYGLD